jgi:hypothetical protein
MVRVWYNGEAGKEEMFDDINIITIAEMIMTMVNNNTHYTLQ